MKMIVTMVPKEIVTNSLLSFFLCFHRNQKQESSFQQVGRLLIRNIFAFLFIASRALLQRYAELKDFQGLDSRIFLIKGFSYMLFLLVL